MTVHAVSFHMRHVYEKLQVHSKSEAVARRCASGSCADCGSEFC